MKALYADVIIGISHDQFDKTFQYAVPDDLRQSVVRGSVVIVPFGRNSKKVTAYVVSLSIEAKIAPEKIKQILSVSSGDEVPEGRMIALAAWIKDYYGGTMSQALKTVMPVREKVRDRESRILTVSDESHMVESYRERMIKKNAKARIRLLDAVISSGSVAFDSIKDELNLTMKTVADLEKAGVIKVETRRVYRNPVVCDKTSKDDLKLNDEQNVVCNTVTSDMKSGKHLTYLLHGVTGSGKTLCYIRIIQEAVRAGKQAIVLIPEIALTFQTVRRFYNSFGDRVSVLNSRMSKGERYDQFLRAARGEIDCIIGPRSALFTPFKNIGIIVIDEEHEESYQSESVPKYHSRQVARHIAKESGATLLLGSATPSIDSFYRAEKGEFKLLTLKKRAVADTLPAVFIEDMREELRAGNRQMFSRKLLAAINKRLTDHEQIMLFINKRGFAGFISCRSCGHVMKCPHCDVSMTYHKNGRLVCHYCGHEEPMVKKCPECGSKYIAGFRVGTQQVEDKIKELFPEAGVLRMDRDTTSGKDGHAKILSKFANHDADILIGTQMIVKGHDFENVTLVAALAADMSLYAGDFRAGERTFDMLTQAAGRAGRAFKPGEVYIQTYSPDNFCIKCVSSHDYTGFYKEEMEFRKMMLYPPVWPMLTAGFSSKDEGVLKMAVEALSDAVEIKNWEIKDQKNHQIIGPSKNVIYKLEDEYRMVLYAKACRDEDITEIKNIIEDYARSSHLFNKVFVQFDRI